MIDEHLEDRSESNTKINEISGYSAFARSCKGLGWDSSIGSIMSTVTEHADDPQWAHILDLLSIRPGFRVIDCGAGRCWASYLLAKRGCDIVAVDLNMDDVAGLRAGRKLIEETGVRFHLVCADLENLPFREEVFHCAFGSQYLHHAYSLKRMLKEIANVLKPGGVMVALNEHVIPIYMSDDRRFRETHPAVGLGVNEHAYHLSLYVASMAYAGLKYTDSFPYPDWESYFGHSVKPHRSRQEERPTGRSWLKKLLVGFLGTIHRLRSLRGIARWVIRSIAMTSFSFVAIKDAKKRK